MCILTTKQTSRFSWNMQCHICIKARKIKKKINWWQPCRYPCYLLQDMCFQINRLYANRHKYISFGVCAWNDIEIHARILHFTSNPHELQVPHLYNNVGTLRQLLMAITPSKNPREEQETDRTKEPSTNDQNKRIKGERGGSSQPPLALDFSGLEKEGQKIEFLCTEERKRRRTGQELRAPSHKTEKRSRSPNGALRRLWILTWRALGFIKEHGESKFLLLFLLIGKNGEKGAQGGKRG